MKFEADKLSKIIEENYSHLMPDFFEMQTEYLASLNVIYHDLDASLVAMVITSDSNQYKVFISLLGNDAIDAAHVGEKISEQPYIGVLFKSQNASTWTPSQYEDLMFKIYRADFTLPTVAAPSRLLLENGELGERNGGSLNLGTNALLTTENSDLIRFFHGNHGMQSTLNYLTVSGVISEVANSTLAADLSTTGVSCEIAENNGFILL